MYNKEIMGTYTLRIISQAIIFCCNLFYETVFGVHTNYRQQILQYHKHKGIFHYQPFGKKFHALICTFPYQNKFIRQSIWDLKFKNQKHYASLFGAVLQDVLIELLSEIEVTHEFTNPVLCIVPSHPHTVRKRGYQVTDLIARHAYTTGLCDWVEYQPDLIVKTKKTPMQSHISSRTLRIQNPKYAFTVNNKICMSKRNIILLDDVYTTGATMNECTRILQESGAHRILQVTVAR